MVRADRRTESTTALRQSRKVLDSYVDEDGNGFPFTVQLFSALKRVGIEEANDKIIELLGLAEKDAAAAPAAAEEELRAPDGDDQANN
jgi:GTP-binding protein